MTNDKLMHLFRQGRVTEDMLRRHFTTLEARAERYRQQRDAANAQISFLLEFYNGGEDVHKN